MVLRQYSNSAQSLSEAPPGVCTLK